MLPPASGALHSNSLNSSIVVVALYTATVGVWVAEVSRAVFSARSRYMAISLRQVVVAVRFHGAATHEEMQIRKQLVFVIWGLVSFSHEVGPLRTCIRASLVQSLVEQRWVMV